VKGTRLILHADGRWFAFDDARVTVSTARPVPSGPAIVVSDFDGAVADVTALEGSPTHAVALIARRLRADGLVDNEAKVLLHKTRTVGAGYQALYTAVPLDRWQSLFAWAENQVDHCLLVPITALLWQCLRKGKGIVLRGGRQLVFMGLAGERIVYVSALAFSDDPDDVAMTVDSLAERVAMELGEDDDAPDALDVTWYQSLEYLSDLSPSREEGYVEAFARATGASVALGSQTRLVDGEGRSCRSGFPALGEHAGAMLSVNSGQVRGAWLAERALPWAAAASLALAVVLATLGGRWTLQAHAANENAEQLRQEAGSIEGTIASLAERQKLAPAYPAVLAFVEKAAALRGGLDAEAAVADVRHAAAGQVSILRVRTEPDGPDGKSNVLRVDGLVHPLAGAAEGSQIALFVQRLRDAGYEPVAVDPNTAGNGGGQSPAGFFSYQLRRPAAQKEHAS
jgi:hypothetical protein